MKTKTSLSAEVLAQADKPPVDKPSKRKSALAL
jgi:hypothetical protein